MLSPDFSQVQASLLDSDRERVGFVLPDSTLVEVANTADNPKNAFVVSIDDLEKYADTAAGTWHTHPHGSSVLSGEDYVNFRNWPDLLHFIVGVDGVSAYRVEGSTVLHV